MISNHRATLIPMFQALPRLGTLSSVVDFMQQPLSVSFISTAFSPRSVSSYFLQDAEQPVRLIRHDTLLGHFRTPPLLGSDMQRHFQVFGESSLYEYLRLHEVRLQESKPASTKYDIQLVQYATHDAYHPPFVCVPKNEIIYQLSSNQVSDLAGRPLVGGQSSDGVGRHPYRAAAL